MAYRIEIKATAEKALSKLPKADARRISTAISGLAKDPRPEGSRKLTGSDDSYRLRVRDYRIVYEITDKKLIVYVVRIGHRKDVYRPR